MNRIKTKQDVFRFLQEQYIQSRLQENDITRYSYAKRLGISVKQASRLLEKGVDCGILVKELALDLGGKRVNRYVPTPGWENKVNGNIFAQVSAQNGYKPARNSDSTKNGRLPSH